MNDILLDPPTPPASENPKLNSSKMKKQVFAIMFLLAVSALLLGILIAPGNSDKSSNPTTVVTQPVVVTLATTPLPVVNKYDQYLEHVYNNSGQANTMSKADLIELGDLICQRLDEGNSIRTIVSVVSNAASTNSDMELGAAAIYGAVHYICSEYISDLNAYLNN